MYFANQGDSLNYNTLRILVNFVPRSLNRLRFLTCNTYFSLLKRVGINLVVLLLAKPNFFFWFLQKGDNQSSCTISFSGARG